MTWSRSANSSWTLQNALKKSSSSNAAKGTQTRRSLKSWVHNWSRLAPNLYSSNKNWWKRTNIWKKVMNQTKSWIVNCKVWVL